MDDLVKFLHDRLDDQGSAYIPDDIEAMRQILKDYEDAARSLSAAEPGTSPHYLTTGASNALKRTIQLLAQPHADHPDYREDWRP